MRERIHAIFDGFQDSTMLLTLVIWVCVVPFVLLFTLPFFGWEGSLTASVVTFFVALAICWGVCFFPKISVEEK